MRRRVLLLMMCVFLGFGAAGDIGRLQLDPEALAEAIPLLMQALAIGERASQRENRHAEELRRKGIAEVEASRAAVKYSIDLGGIGSFLLDDWGEVYIDRRFVTDEEMAVVHRIEAFVAKWFPAEAGKMKSHRRREHAGGAGLPVFRGFEDARYQQHDGLILRLVAEFNAGKAEWCGGTPEQAKNIKDMTAALVKSHMIEESGGNGARSRAAWAVDPLQVNVPGDWGEEKALVGLAKPAKRNSDVEQGERRHHNLEFLHRTGIPRAWLGTQDARSAAPQVQGGRSSLGISAS